MFTHLFSRNGLTLDRLRVLVELANEGSLARAGGNEVQSAQMSRQLKQLEGFFGAKLTRREGHRLVLTQHGRKLEQITRECLIRLTEFDAECKQQPHVLRIGSGSSNLQWLLLPHAGELQRRLTGVRLTLESSRTIPLVDELRELKMDLAIVRDNAVTAPLRKKRLLRLTYSLFVPKRLIPRGYNSEVHKLLEELPLATVGGGGEFQRNLEAAFQKESLTPNITLECASFTEAHRALLTEGYAAILPSSAERDVDAKTFAQLPLPFLKGQERTLCLAWNPRMAGMKPVLEKAVDILIERLSSG